MNTHRNFAAYLIGAAAVVACQGAAAQVSLADQPVFSAAAVPGNLALVLSVEYPTAISAAYGTRTYAAATTYYGYFDPAKCYSYAYSSSDSTTTPAATPASWFAPAAVATAGHLCSGMWSGNFLNWAATPSVDGFRWAMTGGYRVVDTAGSGSTAGATVLERAWGPPAQGNLPTVTATAGTVQATPVPQFPDSSLAVPDIAGATPFGSSMVQGPLFMRMMGLGNKMRFLGGITPNYTADWYTNQTFTAPIANTTTMYGTAGAVAPAPTSSPNSFSVRLKGTVTAPRTGTYWFAVDGRSETLAFYVNGTKLTNPTFNSTAGYVTTYVLTFNAGDTLNIVVEIAQTSSAYRPYTNLYWSIPTATVPWVKIASENAGFAVPAGTQTVRFGAGTSFVSKVFTGPITSTPCTVANFGSDPASGATKECDVQSDWTKVAAENGSFYTTVASQTYRFGADNRWVSKTVAGPAGPVACTVAYFGSDPASGATKECDVAGATTPNYPLGMTSSLDSAVTAYTGDASTAASGTPYEVFVRSKVCDPNAPGGVESNCVNYGSTYKPQGLMQSYSDRLRYSVFSYLNDPDIKRDAGVLRTQQKAIGPFTIAVAGAASAANAAAEWNSSSGLMVTNPDTSDASATAGVSTSGAMNYVNGFGEILRLGYKTKDPLSELYYAAARYFKNLGNVSQWSDMSALSAAARTQAIDGFPVITSWQDPIQYSCQKNFILALGDANTWNDKNVPGNSGMSSEPTLPAAVAADPSPTTPFTSIAKINAMEGGIPGSWGTSSPWAASASSDNSDLIAGLAYDMHTSDIRLDDVSKPQTLGLQTVDTYAVDVQELNTYLAYNPYYMAAKYGGFTVPAGFSPYATGTGTLTDAWWWNGVDKDASTGQKRPNNYFPGGRPDLMRSGLSAAFTNIVAALKQTSTGFAASLPQVAASGSANYASTFDPSTWSGDITGSNVTYGSTGTPSTSSTMWSFATNLAAQASGTGWNTGRRIATWSGSAGVQFTTTALNPAASSTITAAQLATLDTSYISGDDSLAYLRYLRGDRTVEISGAADATHVYRSRASLLGDVTGSKPVPVGAPAFPYADALNPGYSAFKTAYASRRTVVYSGANDGMVHAINGALSTTSSGTLEYDAGAGTEMFAYVPSALFQGPSGAPSTDGLASLGRPVFVHHDFVDAPPVSFDVDFGKTYGASGSPNWRTMLIGGLGKGGASYYALDVTDPAGIVSGGESALATKVLWEFSNPSGLGFSFGEPAAIKLRKYGWVVIVPSGYNNSDGLGHLFIINARTGSLLETVTMPSGSGGLAHFNAFIPDATDGTADALYAGDLAGHLWRVDVTSSTVATYPSPVMLASLTDSGGTGQPITVRPTIQVDPTSGKRFVMLGTGRLLAVSDVSNTQAQSFYAIVDGNSAAPDTAPSGGGSYPITRSMLANNATPGSGAGISLAGKSGWYEDLSTASGTGPQPRVIADATVLYNSVAFSAIVPNSDACAPGGYSQIYAAAFGTGATTLQKGGAPAAFATTGDFNGLTNGAVTDLQFLSVGGTAQLVFGQSNVQGVQLAATAPLVPLTPRRLNWREVPGVN